MLPDAADSPERVSFINGGVPPADRTAHLQVFICPDLLQYDEVWVAIGVWRDVFGVEHTSWSR